MGWWAKSRLPDPGCAEDLQMGTGYWLRNTGEPFLIAKRGRPPVIDRAIRSTIIAERREHSRKPDQCFALAERMAPSVARVELFSRQSRPGWTVWGLEAGKFDGQAA
jgi:N6-adenosine-specific RNA methylase IME4